MHIYVNGWMDEWMTLHNLKFIIIIIKLHMGTPVINGSKKLLLNLVESFFKDQFN